MGIDFNLGSVLSLGRVQSGKGLLQSTRICVRGARLGLVRELIALHIFCIKLGVDFIFRVGIRL